MRLPLFSIRIFCGFSFVVLAALLTGCSTTNSGKGEVATTFVQADNPQIRYSGRFERGEDSSVIFSYSGARVRMRFEGSSLSLRMDDDSRENYVKVWIDGHPQEKFQLASLDGFYQLADGLGSGEHMVEVVRLTECFIGLNRFHGFEIGGPAKVLDWTDESSRRIEFIGDSITCGYGVEAEDANMPFDVATENFCESYSGLTARALDADYLVVSRSGIGMVRNYDGPYEGSEETMSTVYPYTLYADTNYRWDFDRFTPDVICVNLGTNDFSTTGVNPETFVSKYVEFGTMLMRTHPEAHVVVIRGPMENGEGLATLLDRVVSQLGEIDHGRIHLLKLSPQGELGFGASYHPNRKQSLLNAGELTDYLSALMDWR